MTIQLRRQEEKEQRRQSILDAAEKVMEAVGWEATNFSEIAKETRLSRSLIYVYFPTKTDLFHALCDRGAEVLRERFSKALGKGGGGLERIEAIGRAYYEFARDYPIYFKLHAEQEVVAERDASAPPYAHPAFVLLEAALREGLADGSVGIRAEEIKMTALSLWTFTHGLLLIATRKAEFLKGWMGVEAEALVDHGFGMMRGMLKKDGRGSAE